jgi:hypothetical protein
VHCRCVKFEAFLAVGMKVAFRLLAKPCCLVHTNFSKEPATFIGRKFLGNFGALSLSYLESDSRKSKFCPVTKFIFKTQNTCSSRQFECINSMLCKN